MYIHNRRYGGGTGVCEYGAGPKTFEWGVKASQKHALEPNATQKHALGPSGISGTQRHTDALPTHQVLLRAPFLEAPGARMTVVELGPSNHRLL